MLLSSRVALVAAANLYLVAGLPNPEGPHRAANLTTSVADYVDETNDRGRRYDAPMLDVAHILPREASWTPDPSLNSCSTLHEVKRSTVRVKRWKGWNVREEITLDASFKAGKERLCELDQRLHDCKRKGCKDRDTKTWDPGYKFWFSDTYKPTLRELINGKGVAESTDTTVVYPQLIGLDHVVEDLELDLGMRMLEMKLGAHRPEGLQHAGTTQEQTVLECFVTAYPIEPDAVLIINGINFDEEHDITSAEQQRDPSEHVFKMLKALKWSSVADHIRHVIFLGVNTRGTVDMMRKTRLLTRERESTKKDDMDMQRLALVPDGLKALENHDVWYKDKVATSLIGTMFGQVYAKILEYYPNAMGMRVIKRVRTWVSETPQQFHAWKGNEDPERWGRFILALETAPFIEGLESLGLYR